MKVEAYVKTFYENTAEGKLLGQKCNRCGVYKLFPMPVCSNCHSTDLSWVELKKEGKLLLFTVSYHPPERFAHLTPCVIGFIHLLEGPAYFGLVEGIDVKNVEAEFARLPRVVDIETKEIAGNWIPVAKVREQIFDVKG